MRTSPGLNAAALFMLFTASPALAQAPHNLLDDGGFEAGMSGFATNQAGTTLRLSTSGALAGAQSLVAGTRSYGDSVLWTGSRLEGMASKRSGMYTVSARLRSHVPSRSKIGLCALADYADGQSARACRYVAGALGDKGTVSVRLALDASRDIARVRLGLFQEGSAALKDVMIDSVVASLDGVAPPVVAPTLPEPGPLPAPSNLVADPGFESGTSGFGPNQSGTSASVVSAGAISGAHSLSIGTAGYGDSVLWQGREWQQLSGRRASLYTVSARVRMTTDSSSALQLCAMADYADGGYATDCASVGGSVGDKGVVSITLALDPLRDLERVRIGLFQEGGAALANVLLDEVSAVLAGITPVANPSPDPGPGPTPPPTPTPTPPTGTPYPGYTYNLPAQRPFISLDDFQAASRSGDAFTRLKAQVDDVVRITNTLPLTATYEQLIGALNASHYGYSAVDSVLMYRLTGEVQYIDQALRMTGLFVASEQSRIAAGSQPAIAGDSYLEVGHLLEQLALSYDHGYARLTPAQRAAWEGYAGQALSNVWNPSAASWGGVSRPWSGWSVNDPGNNYYYSFLKATQLWALATQSASSIGFLQQQKFTQLVPFFSQLQGGGSREGTGYGTAMGSLFENYRYWKSATGEDLSALSPHARDTIDYWIHATVPTLDYYASIGDQARMSMPRMFDYQRKLVEEAVALGPESDAGRRGTWWLNRIKVTDGGGGSVQGRMRYAFNFRYDLLARSSAEQAPALLAYDAAGVGALFARSGWTTAASWMSLVAGVYDQSHAHQDQGSFSFFKDSWLAVTSNVFSHSGINQGVDLHNIVRFDVHGAALGQNHVVLAKTVADSGDALTVSANLTPAYARHGPQVANWVRTLTYLRSSHTLQVRDQCSVAPGVQAVWQLHVPARPVVQADGGILAGQLHIRPILPATPEIGIVDMQALSGEYSGGFRIELRSANTCGFQVDLQAL